MVLTADLTTIVNHLYASECMDEHAIILMRKISDVYIDSRVQPGDVDAVRDADPSVSCDPPSLE